MCKKDERFRQYEKLMKQKKPEEKPASCKKCLYYQPKFQFRICFFAKCPFDKNEAIFRDRPLKVGPFV